MNNQKDYIADYEATKKYRKIYCKTCGWNQCVVKYVGDLGECKGYKPICLCEICVDSKCGAIGLKNHIQEDCHHYKPNPKLTEFWYKGKQIICKNRVRS